MNDLTANVGTQERSDIIYFAPLLPWQQTLWSQLTQRVLTQQFLPHALLAAGMQGMGKRAFVLRLVAWLLCRERDTNPLGACATCESCQWLKSGTHPSLQCDSDKNLITQLLRLIRGHKQSAIIHKRQIAGIQRFDSLNMAG